jgi:hypothetical protein
MGHPMSGGEMRMDPMSQNRDMGHPRGDRWVRGIPPIHDKAVDGLMG